MLVSRVRRRNTTIFLSWFNLFGLRSLIKKFVIYPILLGLPVMNEDMEMEVVDEFVFK